MKVQHKESGQRYELVDTGEIWYVGRRISELGGPTGPVVLLLKADFEPVPQKQESA